jgi:prepilin-type N-terminal cleavage/methylation domain-containing protein
MKSMIPANREGASRQAAYTLPEVMVGISIIAVMFVTLYLGFTQGFGVVQASRENLRATQILQQYSELIRLYTWEQLTNGTAFPHPYTKTWTFYPMGAPGSRGVTYTGTMSVDSSDIVEDYAADTKKVTITLNWTSGNVTRQRQMTTMVSKYGLHNYIFNPQAP